MKYLVLCATLNLLFFANTVWSAVYVAPIYSDTEHSLTIYNAKQPLKVSCTVNATEGEDVEVLWRKDGEAVKSIKSIKDRVTEKRSDTTATLIVAHSNEDDAGNYSCVAIVKQTEITNATVRAVCSVKVKMTPRDINVVEGEKLRITCTVIGNPTPTLSWIVLGNITYTTSDGRIKLLEDERHIPNAILQIDAIEMTDRGEYTCIARSNLTDEEDKDIAMVRVKDKYAPLWPFLGICVEVFVLCAIILIYEKKRNKTELEESDTDQSPDQKNTPDHGKESNLRHRQ